jgi:hypothetical protein
MKKRKNYVIFEVITYSVCKQILSVTIPEKTQLELFLKKKINEDNKEKKAIKKKIYIYKVVNVTRIPCV